MPRTSMYHALGGASAGPFAIGVNAGAVEQPPTMASSAMETSTAVVLFRAARRDNRGMDRTLREQKRIVPENREALGCRKVCQRDARREARDHGAYLGGDRGG